MNLWTKIIVASLIFAFLIFDYHFFFERERPASRVFDVSDVDSTSTGRDVEKPGKNLRSKPMASAAVKLSNTPADAPSYNGSKNLLEFLNGLQGDPSKKRDYELAKAKAYRECVMFAKAPHYVEDLIKARQAIKPEQTGVVTQLAAEQAERCQGLADSGPVSMSDAESLYVDAARQGSPEARAHLLVASIVTHQATASVSDQFGQAIDLIDSGDPAAIFELANLFGTNTPFSGPATGNEKATAAWRLAACDMGLDCSANSSIIISACLNGGMYCEGGDLRYDMQQGQFSPTEYAEVVALEKKILDHIENGNAENLFQS